MAPSAKQGWWILLLGLSRLVFCWFCLKSPAPDSSCVILYQNLLMCIDRYKNHYVWDLEKNAEAAACTSAKKKNNKKN